MSESAKGLPRELAEAFDRPEPPLPSKPAAAAIQPATPPRQPAQPVSRGDHDDLGWFGRCPSKRVECRLLTGETVRGEVVRVTRYEVVLKHDGREVLVMKHAVATAWVEESFSRKSLIRTRT